MMEEVRRSTCQWVLLTLATVMLAIGVFAAPGNTQTEVDDPVFCPWAEYASCAFDPESGFMYRHLENLE